MKVLIKLKGPSTYLLVKVTEDETINEVLSLVNKRLYLNAIETIVAKGVVIRDVKEFEVHLVEANLIITERQAHFDLLVD